MGSCEAVVVAVAEVTVDDVEYVVLLESVVGLVLLDDVAELVLVNDVEVVLEVSLELELELERCWTSALKSRLELELVPGMGKAVTVM